MRPFAVILAVLALAAPAAAATPGFALFDVQSDLAPASRNAYGDLQVRPRTALAGRGALVRCGAWCRFGDGWLAFRASPHLGSADVASSVVRFSKREGWTVQLALRPAGAARWASFVKLVTIGAKRRGVPDVLVVVAGGEVAATPFASQVASAAGRVTLTGFSRASATALVRSLR